MDVSKKSGTIIQALQFALHSSEPYKMIICQNVIITQIKQIIPHTIARSLQLSLISDFDFAARIRKADIFITLYQYHKSCLTPFNLLQLYCTLAVKNVTLLSVHLSQMSNFSPAQPQTFMSVVCTMCILYLHGDCTILYHENMTKIS